MTAALHVHVHPRLYLHYPNYMGGGINVSDLITGIANSLLTQVA